MSRRLTDRSNVLPRPRQKGWWGEPDEHDRPVEELPAQDAPRRHAAQRPLHGPTAAVGRALTPGQIASIRAVMRLFIDDDVAGGVDPRLTLFCNRCGTPRQAIGSVRYDRATFCHECCVEFEVTRARGLVESAAEYVLRYPARSASA